MCRRKGADQLKKSLKANEMPYLLGIGSLIDAHGQDPVYSLLYSAQFLDGWL